MPQDTDTKQEAGTVSNSSSTDLLASYINAAKLNEAREALDCGEATAEIAHIYAALLGMEEFANETAIDHEADGFTGYSEEARNRAFRYSELRESIAQIFS